jgi:hypothetical protein
MSKDSPVLFSETIAPVQRAHAGELFLLRIEAIPVMGTVESEEVGGGFINCWISADDLRSAELRAIEMIKAEGWKPHRFDGWQLLTHSNCTDDDDRESFIQATRDGISMTIFTWPPGVDTAE